MPENSSSANTTIELRLAQVQQRVRQAEQRYGRKPDSVQILAVSKTRPPEDIAAVAKAGLLAVGENYLQEALEKMDALEGLHLQWHFIGPIQSNKTQPIAQRFDWVHSVDREKIARRLSEQRPANLAPLNICLQVNISREASKSGVMPEDLPELAHQVSELPRLRLRGLMAIPAESSDFEAQRASFHALREAYEQLNIMGLQLDTLSMGMSADLEAAIAEGATIVRVGTDIFGSRPKQVQDQSSRQPANGK